MPVLTTPIGPIETLEWGDGAELILLLHAAAAGPGSLSGMAKALSRPGRRIVAPALHGYAGTAIVCPGSRMDAHVAVARECLAVIPAERRVVFGHSMGGLVALLASMPDDPGRSGSAAGSPHPPVGLSVVYEPIVMGLLRDDDPEDAAARRWDRDIVSALEQSVQAGDPEPGLRRFVVAWNELSWPDLPASVRARLIAAAPGLVEDIICGSSAGFNPGAIAPPPLILQGGRSPVITARMTQRLHQAMPGSRRVVLTDCGHMGPVQAPQAVAAAMQQAGMVL